MGAKPRVGVAVPPTVGLVSAVAVGATVVVVLPPVGGTGVAVAPTGEGGLAGAGAGGGGGAEGGPGGGGWRVGPALPARAAPTPSIRPSAARRVAVGPGVKRAVADDAPTVSTSAPPRAWPGGARPRAVSCGVASRAPPAS